MQHGSCSVENICQTATKTFGKEEYCSVWIYTAANEALRCLRKRLMLFISYFKKGPEETRGEKRTRGSEFKRTKTIITLYEKITSGWHLTELYLNSHNNKNQVLNRDIMKTPVTNNNHIHDKRARTFFCCKILILKMEKMEKMNEIDNCVSL